MSAAPSSPAASAAAAALPRERVVYEGWLVKQGRRLRGWQKRWFTLTTAGRLYGSQAQRWAADDKSVLVTEYVANEVTAGSKDRCQLLLTPLGDAAGGGRPIVLGGAAPELQQWKRAVEYVQALVDERRALWSSAMATAASLDDLRALPPRDWHAEWHAARQAPPDDDPAAHLRALRTRVLLEAEFQHFIAAVAVAARRTSSLGGAGAGEGEGEGEGEPDPLLAWFVGRLGDRDPRPAERCFRVGSVLFETDDGDAAARKRLAQERECNLTLTSLSDAPTLLTEVVDCAGVRFLAVAAPPEAPVPAVTSSSELPRLQTALQAHFNVTVRELPVRVHATPSDGRPLLVGLPGYLPPAVHAMNVVDTDGVQNTVLGVFVRADASRPLQLVGLPTAEDERRESITKALVDEASGGEEPHCRELPSRGLLVWHLALDRGEQNDRATALCAEPVRGDVLIMLPPSSTRSPMQLHANFTSALPAPLPVAPLRFGGERSKLSPADFQLLLRAGMQLTDAHLPAVAEGLADVWSGHHLTQALHDAGVSIRYLPLLRDHVHPPALRRMVDAEIVARVAKHALACRLRVAPPGAAARVTAVLLSAVLCRRAPPPTDIPAEPRAEPPAQDYNEEIRAAARTFWSVESRIWMLLGPFGVHGCFSFPPNADGDDEHLATALSPAELLPPLLRHLHCALAPAAVLRVLSRNADPFVSPDEILVLRPRSKGHSAEVARVREALQRFHGGRAPRLRLTAQASLAELATIVLERAPPAPALIEARLQLALADAVDRAEAGHAPPIEAVRAALEGAAGADSAVEHVITMRLLLAAASNAANNARNLCAAWRLLHSYFPAGTDGHGCSPLTSVPPVALAIARRLAAVTPDAALAARVGRFLRLHGDQDDEEEPLWPAVRRCLLAGSGSGVRCLEPDNCPAADADVQWVDANLLCGGAGGGRLLGTGQMMGLMLEEQVRRRAETAAGNELPDEAAAVPQERAAPLPLLAAHVVRKVACGFRHTALITTEGALLTFGYGECGRLGHGDEEPVAEPRVVETFRGAPVADVACGREHTVAALRDGGRVFAFGWGEAGRLGLGEAGKTLLPAEMLPALPAPAVAVACGREHTLLVLADGALMACGAGYGGRLGLGDARDAPHPARVAFPPGAAPVVSAAGGECHSAALTADGAVFTWGFGHSGALGLGDDETRKTPELVALPERAVELRCGSYHTVVRTAAGALWGWGDGEGGQLGVPSRGDEATHKALAPIALTHVLPGPAAALACGAFTTGAVVDGVAYAWGCPDVGDGGQPTPAQLAPQPLAGLDGLRVAALAHGSYHQVMATEARDRWGRPWPPLAAHTLCPRCDVLVPVASAGPHGETCTGSPPPPCTPPRPSPVSAGLRTPADDAIVEAFLASNQTTMPLGLFEIMTEEERAAFAKGSSRRTHFRRRGRSFLSPSPGT